MFLAEKPLAPGIFDCWDAEREETVLFPHPSDAAFSLTILPIFQYMVIISRFTEASALD